MQKRLRRPAPLILFVVFVAIMLIVDRISKILAVQHLAHGALPFIPGILDFTLTYNSGAAFGLFEGGSPFFLIMALLVSAAVVLYFIIGKKHATIEILALGFIVSGALGNAIDRIREGKVTDFFHTQFIEFPIFNIADCCITVGAILLFVFIIFGGFGSTNEKAQEETSLTSNEHDQACKGKPDA